MHTPLFEVNFYRQEAMALHSIYTNHYNVVRLFFGIPAIANNQV